MQQLFISDQPNGVSDVTTYWDNVSLTVSPIPEPVSIYGNGRPGTTSARPAVASPQIDSLARTGLMRLSNVAAN